uniref:Uncharacterized protein n=1 Tax=Sphenodon punctatus TaxID=8508 RepID=A0A8D0GH13_SPHPU
MLLLRKLPGMPGWPAALGLRLPQKFLFLLFLSGLLTLCFGALFLLPDSSRFKRLFLPRRTTTTTAAADLPRSPQAAAAEPHRASPAASQLHHHRGKLSSPPGMDAPPAQTAASAGGNKQQVQPGEGAAEEETDGAPAAARTRAPFRFDYERFHRSLRHPVLGTPGSEEPETCARRLKIKEMTLQIQMFSKYRSR